MSTFFSLLMPTRNRAEYLSAGVGFFLKGARDDFELIVSDASDAHAGCLQALSPWLSDSRLRVIDNTVEATGRVASMTDNWSCALDHTRGQWISIIGDDDVCDPEVLPFLEQLVRLSPGISAATWHRMHFDIGIDTPREAKIPMGNKIMLAAGRDSVVRQIQWPNGKKPPTSLVSPYHGAVRRDVLDKIRKKRGKWYQFRIPDYDHGWSVAMEVDQFVVCERPFSITGVCPKSNSYSLRNEKMRVEYLEKWNIESRELDGWGKVNDPFLFTLPMTVLGFRNAFCSVYGLDAKINLENLVGTLKNNLQNQEDDYSFEENKRSLGNFFQMHFGQDFGVATLKRVLRPQRPMAGLVGEKIFMPNTLFDGNITLFSDVAFGMVRPVEYLFSSANT